MEQQHRRLGDNEANVQAMEKRLLAVIRDGGTGAMPKEQVNGELVLLAQDLRRAFRWIQGRLERRDVSFDDEVRLKELRTRCLWLYRKARQEEIFFRKLQLEERLRQMISDESFAVYQALQEADEEQHWIATEDPGAEQPPVQREGEGNNAARTTAAVASTPEQ